jgi:hypothetical protein
LLVYPAGPHSVKDCLALRMEQLQNLLTRAGLLRKIGNDDTTL